MATYRVRFVHKISPSDKDVREVDLPDGFSADKLTMAKALRKCGVLPTGGRLRLMRAEGSQVVAFPSGGIWHSFIVTPK